MRQTKANLDRILKHTKFDSRTKALWSYFRGNYSSAGFRGHGYKKAVRLILVNLHLNGAIDDLIGRSPFRADTPEWIAEATDQLVRRFRPVTVAHWKHAIELIDIAKS